jgi:hypothetical protein
VYVVDEGSNDVISKEEAEALVRGDALDEEKEESGTKADKGQEADGAEAKEPAETGRAEGRVAEKTAEIGATKKRKAGKVVGGDNTAAENGAANETVDERRVQAKSKPQKKGKRIKLSFDDPEAS